MLQKLTISDILQTYANELNLYHQLKPVIIKCSEWKSCFKITWCVKESTVQFGTLYNSNPAICHEFQF